MSIQVKVYCVGQNELFAPLWELNLFDQQVICVLLA